MSALEQRWMGSKHWRSHELELLSMAEIHYSIFFNPFKFAGECLFSWHSLLSEIVTGPWHLDVVNLLLPQKVLPSSPMHWVLVLIQLSLAVWLVKIKAPGRKLQIQRDESWELNNVLPGRYLLPTCRWSWLEQSAVFCTWGDKVACSQETGLTIGGSGNVKWKFDFEPIQGHVQVLRVLCIRCGGPPKCVGGQLHKMYLRNPQVRRHWQFSANFTVRLAGLQGLS